MYCAFCNNEITKADFEETDTYGDDKYSETYHFCSRICRNEYVLFRFMVIEKNENYDKIKAVLNEDYFEYTKKLINIMKR